MTDHETAIWNQLTPRELEFVSPEAITAVLRAQAAAQPDPDAFMVTTALGSTHLLLPHEVTPEWAMKADTVLDMYVREPIAAVEPPARVNEPKWRVEDESENVLFEGTADECRAYCWKLGYGFTRIPNWHKFVAKPKEPGDDVGDESHHSHLNGGDL